MGAFYKICPECGKAFMWFSFNALAIIRSVRCTDCWWKLEHPVTPVGPRKEA